MAQALLEQIINGTMMGSIYMLVALGMVLIYGVMHVLNFAHGVLFMVGGYVCHFFFTQVLDSYLLAILGSMAVLSIIGLALERGVFRRLRDNLRMQVIASLGLILVIQNGVIAIWGPNALQMRITTTNIRVPIGELSFTLQHFLIIGTVGVTVTAIWLFLTRTRIGTALRATSQNAEAAQVVGIDANRMYVASFLIGCALAALGGALLGPLFLIFPTMGDLPLLKGLAAIIIGGMGSIPGAIIGGLGIGIVEAVSTLYIPTDFRDTVVFAALIAVLLLRPQGLFGVRVRGEA
ncbi:MAG: branched-chain amino acid ABC transporter permease [Pseudomonadota bacterium]